MKVSKLLYEIDFDEIYQMRPSLLTLDLAFRCYALKTTQCDTETRYKSANYSKIN